MPTLEAVRSALEKFLAGGAGEADRRLIGEAVCSGRVVLAEGERSLALGGSADGATILTGDGTVVVALDAGAARALRALLGPPVPRQLPSDLPDFTGRASEIAALERALGGDGGRAAITAISGMGGVGKTALAMHVAHRLAVRYPDGQVVVDLKGTAEPLSPSAAMCQVVVALDPVRQLPDNSAELAGLYRSLLSGKRLLILFDNAEDAVQVRELLPAPPGAAIVTSRRAVVLSGLQRVPLDVLAAEEADALLRGIIGEERASAAERATLAERCGLLPLALRLAGTFLVSYADRGVGEYLAALADERELERLLRLRIEGDALLNVSPVLGPSLRQLAPDRPELVVGWRMLADASGIDPQAAAMVWKLAAQVEQLQSELKLKYIEGQRDLLISQFMPIFRECVLKGGQMIIGQITNLAMIEGLMSKDTYNIRGPTGAVGPNAHAHDMTFQQVWNQSGLDLPRLAQELAQLRAAMKQETENTAEQDEAIGTVAAAEKAAARGDGPTALGCLKSAGRWTLGVAEKIGVAVAAEAIKRTMMG